LVKEEDESWQTELRELIYNGSAMVRVLKKVAELLKISD
jgi:hypothetical protein